MMARIGTSLFSTLAGLSGGALVILLLAWLSWRNAVGDEQARLLMYAERIAVRAEISLAQARQALTTMNASTLAPCSAPHIALMRRLTANTRSVEEIGYFSDQVLQCSSWGATQTIIRAVPGIPSIGGTSVAIGITPLFTGADRMLAVNAGRYNALIHAGRFTDVIADEGVQLAFLHENGAIVSRAGAIDAAFADFLRELAGHKSGVVPDPHWLVAIKHDGGWVSMALSRPPSLLASFRHDRDWIIPAGLIIGILLALCIGLLRKPISPVSELRMAIRQREFVVHYQPIIALASGRCVGAEALVRWQRPDGGMVRPDLFIPLAEETGLIADITDQVIEAIVRDLNDALRQDRTLHIAVNLCAADIQSGRILCVLAQALDGTGISPDRLWLEATERSLMDAAAAKTTLDAARARGHLIAVDDFGTGYSGLQYLENLPFDVLKIDKTFIASIGTMPASGGVIAHIIDMARSLNLRVVAEGVETQEQADYLAARGVEMAQGWLYARAMPAADFQAFLQRRGHA